jgi:hypothetical protein
MTCNSLQEGRATERVECIRNVHLEKNLVGGRSGPIQQTVDYLLACARDSHADLQRRQLLLNSPKTLPHESFGGQPPKGVAARNGPEAAVLFRDG